MVARVVNDRCPGALHAVPARDGLLARIRIPGGMISPAQLAALADLSERCGDGALDITARANVQLRGLREETLPSLSAGLIAAGLLPSTAHDRVRNILTGAFAGLDPEELLDTRPLVRELDAALLSDPAFTALPAKFGFAIDGGGKAPLDLSSSDLALSPAREADGALLLRLAIGGRALDAGVRPEHAVGVLLDAARAAIATAAALDPGRRRWRLAALPGAEEAIRAALGDRLRRAAANGDARDARAALPPLGVWPMRRSDHITLAPCVALGRLDTRQARGVAELALRHAADLRLAPWRGIVLGAIARDALAETEKALRRLDLPLDNADGYAGLVACAGLTGCTEALGDVRGLAERLTRSRVGALRSPQTINMAGCAKRCGMRAGADAEIVASAGGYELTVNGRLVRQDAREEEILLCNWKRNWEPPKA